MLTDLLAWIRVLLGNARQYALLVVGILSEIFYFFKRKPVHARETQEHEYQIACMAEL